MEWYINGTKRKINGYEMTASRQFEEGQEVCPGWALPLSVLIGGLQFCVSQIIYFQIETIYFQVVAGHVIYFQ